MAETPYDVAYEAAVNALTHQSAALDELRARTGVLLAAASVSTAFLGSEALKSSNASAFDWLAVVCFFGVGTAAVCILWPREGWKFVVDPAILVQSYIEIEDPPGLDKIKRDIALHLGNHYKANQKRLNSLFWWFQLGCVLLVVEIVSWLIALTGAA